MRTITSESVLSVPPCFARFVRMKCGTNMPFGSDRRGFSLRIGRPVAIRSILILSRLNDHVVGGE